MINSRRSFGWLLVFVVLAFAGRPLYVCTMEQIKQAEAEMPCAHAACEHCPQPEQSASDCMLEANNPTAPAVEKVQIAPSFPLLLADLAIVQALTPSGPAPSLPQYAAFESPPSSITILRI